MGRRPRQPRTPRSVAAGPGGRRRQRPRRWKGQAVNAELRAESVFRPGEMDWVDDEACSVCGERYEAVDLGVTWDDGVQLVRRSNPNGPTPGSSGGFRSRGPILFAMKQIKRGRWYDRHIPCRWYVGAGLPQPLVWACIHGDDCAALEAVERARDLGFDADQVEASSDRARSDRAYLDEEELEEIPF